MKSDIVRSKETISDEKSSTHDGKPSVNYCHGRVLLSKLERTS